MTVVGPPQGASGKEPPSSGTAPVQTPRVPVSAVNTELTTDINPNIGIMRALIERTERGNIRIKKLNIKKQRRLMALVDEVVSDDEPEDPVPNVSLFLSQPVSSPDILGPMLTHVPATGHINVPERGSTADNHGD